jgi:hypothetical protein
MNLCAIGYSVPDSSCLLFVPPSYSLAGLYASFVINSGMNNTT